MTGAMTTPDATAGDGLREALARVMWEEQPGACLWDELSPTTPTRGRWLAVADTVLALPALRDVLAAAARDAELREAVTSLTVRFETLGEALHSVPEAEAYADAAESLRAALDGTS